MGIPAYSLIFACMVTNVRQILGCVDSMHIRHFIVFSNFIILVTAIDSTVLTEGGLGAVAESTSFKYLHLESSNTLRKICMGVLVQLLLTESLPAHEETQCASRDLKPYKLVA